MTYFKKLTGEKCYLSPIRMEDAEIYTKWFNDMETSLYIFSRPDVTSLEKRKEILLKQIKSGSPVFGIIDKKTDRIIGDLTLMKVDQINGASSFGITIGEKEYLNKGYGTDATKLILDYGFNMLNLHNIMLNVFEFNKRAIASYKKIGFKEIGRRRGARLIAGKRYDTIFMDITADEFDSVYVKKVMEITL